MNHTLTGNQEIDGLLLSLACLDPERAQSVDVRYRHSGTGELAARFQLVSKPLNDYWMTRTFEVMDAELLSDAAGYHVYVDAKARREDDQDWLDGRVNSILRHET